MDNFYSAYEKQLQDRFVRAVHDNVFYTYRRLHYLNRPMRTIDLGCATCEFGRYSKPIHDYVGIDLAEDLKSEFKIIKADFREPLPAIGFEPTSFVSLFAAELYLLDYERNELYNRMFSTYPTIYSALISGIYYKGREKESSIQEPCQYNIDGQIISTNFTIQQTIQQPIYNKLYDEYRYTKEVPYQMFGPGVIEVWKFLIRRENESFPPR